MLDGRVKRGTGCKLAVSNSNPFCDPLLDEDPPDSTDRNLILLFEDFETRESFDSLLGGRRVAKVGIFWNSKEVYIRFLEASTFSPMAF